MASRRELSAALDEVAALVDRARRRHRSAWSGIVAAQPGQPKAQSYDEDRAGGTHSTRFVSWCEGHERELDRCHADGLQCEGRTIPAPSDPTGEAAVSASPGRRDGDRYVRAVAKAVGALRDLEALQATYAVEDTVRPCDLCDRSRNRRGDPLRSYVERSTVHGLLPVPMRLCRSCYRTVEAIGRVPTPAELQRGAA